MLKIENKIALHHSNLVLDNFAIVFKELGEILEKLDMHVSILH